MKPQSPFLPYLSTEYCHVTCTADRNSSQLFARPGEIARGITTLPHCFCSSHRPAILLFRIPSAERLLLKETPGHVDVNV